MSELSTEEIIMRYERALATQKRRKVIRLVMSGVLISTAFLNYFEVSVFENARALFYLALLAFFVFSYFVLDRKVGANKDLLAIVEHYMSKDISLKSIERK